MLAVVAIPTSIALAKITGQSSNYGPAQPVAASQSGPGCEPGFNVVEAADPGFPSELSDISAVASNDIWAVGYSDTDGGSRDGLIEHYNGTDWTRFNSATVSTDTHILRAVDARASNDAWAVGYYLHAAGYAQTLVNHWNGNEWTLVPSPNITGVVNTLSGVAAVAPDDVWAVGGYRTAEDVRRTLIMHWNGTAWSIVNSPNHPSADNFLTDVVAISSDDIWAVGWHTPTGGRQVPHVMHWDGVTWSFQPIDMPPSKEPVDGSLVSIAATGPDDIWAVGTFGGYPLVEHWDGTSWTRVNSPGSWFSNLRIMSVAASSPTDAWIAGYYWSGQQYKTLVQHWNGIQWSNFSSVTFGANDNRLNGVAALGPQDVWVAGSYEVQVGDWVDRRAMLQHYNGGCTTPTITPTSTATATSTATNTATATPTCGTGWSVVVGSAQPTRVAGRLLDVSASSSSDAWAVGWTPNSQFIEVPSILHWNGSSWASVPVTATESWGEFRAVAAISPIDAWAVGSLGGQTSTFRWNGITWTRVPSPLTPTPYDASRLNAISVVSPTDIWAVGYSYSGSSTRAMIIRWNGLAWNLVTLPSSLYSTSSTPTALHAVKAFSANDVWVAGGNGFGVPALLHWDGNTWSSVSPVAPDETQYQYYTFFGLDGTSSNDLWAVGSYQRSVSLSTVPVVQHWNGSNWSVVQTPSLPITQGGIYFTDVDAISADDAWIVGTTWNASVGEQRSLIEHWNGSAWSLVAAPENTSQQVLEAVEALSDQYIWAVGNIIGSPDRILIDRYNDYCGGNVGQASATATVTSTATRTATRTATSTSVASRTPSPQPQPTACSLEFADVPSSGPGSTFYSFVRCLACRAIVSGYPCGGAGEPCNGSNDPYFRPGLNVTRGQISKMVALAANLSGSTGNQIFEDVQPGSTFYDPIQQLASRGYIGGYPCGGAGEPCEAGNLPYFRPGVNTTRGQLSKIVSETARFNEGPGPQKFADVPGDSPFFVWINRLANRGVISGYSCGGAGEGCDAQSRPYLRPNDKVTRGQTAKIVANTFFPNCYTPARK